MTPEQIELVRSSYASIDNPSAMASDFYRRLFAIDPSARSLFSQDPAVMAEKFAAELSAIVQAIITFDAFAARLSHLAVRHHAAGVRSRHYRSVGEALMQALTERLGSGWTPATEGAWRRAYNLVAEIMIAASADLETASPRPLGAKDDAEES
ncbi:MAG TPA: globin domain-containing protein [Streptosporangiaceae bacterium]|jgi:hemoglobin-like flavoprotein|nr:globin domain-containing protein [Streptosporangiaceae bacterium]